MSERLKARAIQAERWIATYDDLDALVAPCHGEYSLRWLDSQPRERLTAYGEREKISYSIFGKIQPQWAQICIRAAFVILLMMGKMSLSDSI